VDGVKRKSKSGTGRREFRPSIFGVFLMEFLGLTPEGLVELFEAEGLLSGEKKSEPSLDGSDSLGTKGDG
jgi:hypothetical protein